MKKDSTLRNSANTCLHKPTSYKFYPFRESDKEMCKKNTRIIDLWIFNCVHSESFG